MMACSADHEKIVRSILSKEQIDVNAKDTNKVSKKELKHSNLTFLTNCLPRISPGNRLYSVDVCSRQGIHQCRAGAIGM